MSYPLSNLGTVPPIFGDSPRQKGATKHRRTRSLPQKRSIVHTTKVHICNIFAIIASYHPKSRLNRGGFAKTRLNKRHLGELSWAGTVPSSSQLAALTWAGTVPSSYLPSITSKTLKNILCSYSVSAIRIQLGTVASAGSDCPQFSSIFFS